MIDDQSTTTTPTFHDWQELDDTVKATGSVLRVPMIALRTLAGKQRLKVRVVAGLEQELANIGIGHLPASLPNGQNEWVVLYKIGSPAGSVIAAVRAGTSTKAAETALRDLNTSNTAAAKRGYEAKLLELGEHVAELEALAKRMADTIQEEG